MRKASWQLLLLLLWLLWLLLLLLLLRCGLHSDGWWCAHCPNTRHRRLLRHWHGHAGRHAKRGDWRHTTRHARGHEPHWRACNWGNNASRCQPFIQAMHKMVCVLCVLYVFECVRTLFVGSDTHTHIRTHTHTHNKTKTVTPCYQHVPSPGTWPMGPTAPTPPIPCSSQNESWRNRQMALWFKSV